MLWSYGQAKKIDEDDDNNNSNNNSNNNKNNYLKTPSN